MNKKLLKLGSIAGVLSFAPVAISAGCGSKGEETPADSVAAKKALVEQSLKDLNAKIEAVTDETKKAELKKEAEAIKKDFDAAKTVKDFEAVDTKIKEVAAKVESGSTPTPSKEEKYQGCLSIVDKDKVLEFANSTDTGNIWAYSYTTKKILLFKGGKINWKSPYGTAFDVKDSLLERVSEKNVQLVNPETPTYSGGKKLSAYMKVEKKGNELTISFRVAKYDKDGNHDLSDETVYRVKVSLA